MAFLEIRGETRRKVFQILDREFTVGREEGDALRLAGDDVCESHLRVVQVGGGHRVTPGAEGARLIVNGRSLPLRTLEHGDRVEVGSWVLVYCVEGQPRPPDDEPGPEAGADDADDAGSPAALDLQIETIPSARAAGTPAVETARSPARSPARRGAVPEPGPRRPRRRRGMPRAMLIWNVILVTVVVGYLVFSQLASGGVERDPLDLVTLAESQRASGDDERALATLGLALERATDPALRGRIRALQRHVEASFATRADVGGLRRAASGADAIRRFVAMHLVEEPAGRPAARELCELVRAWLDAFREVCARHQESRPTVDEMEDYLRRYQPAAQEDESDVAEDVLFSAGRRLRFARRRYPEAIRILEGWLAVAPADAAGRCEVEERAAFCREQGQLWVEQERAAVERLVEQGVRELAIERLRYLIEHGTLPEWEGDARPRLRELESAGH